MRTVKKLVMAAVVAANVLLVGATPQPAAAEVTVSAALVAALPDGTYAVYENGRLIGYITVRNGVIVSGSAPSQT